ncbi:aerobic respiration two-component sensor histidine kinase ArcB [Catenovulum sp. SM1970]|uniref:aerobic respiration two-component sensor histidine kinase ArcB n=1 Tax=Marinifaba aquimaris TaxID=2741323 RepID=UPI001572389D|nr:aerobic respiration two-component sensor histidine kinase ArcB [Marinifaba aquimaris]NTS78507.1 aerobic respiration two-component sensor histidine kinase ArcB [Marinifaba aquimaris]
MNTKITTTRPWPAKFAEMVNHYGTFAVSLVFLSIAIFIAIIETSIVEYLMHGELSLKAFFPSILLTLIIAPAFLFFIFELIARLHTSQDEIQKAVSELENLRAQDLQTATNLRKNIKQLNFEIEIRKRAELQREEAITLLQSEIEERKRTEMSLNAQKVLLRSCFDCSPDIIYYRDDNGRFAGCNKSLEAVTGMTEKEMIGLTPWQVYTHEVAEQVIASDKEVLASNTSISYDIWLPLPDGTRRLYEFKKVPFFNEAGKRIGLLGFGRDVMERKLAQDRLEQMNRDKTAFISTISHELRTPLNGIVGISRILQASLASNEQKKQAKIIHACAITLGNIFNDIVDLDKIERNALKVHLEPIELHELIDELATVTELQSKHKGLGFVFEHNILETLWVKIDPTRLRQVLWNLLSNAMKFTLKGEVKFLVDVAQQGEKVWLDFEVVDSGIGIAENEIDNIFNMYYQVDREEVSSSSGTGIGLAISKMLVEAMDGQIEVYSEVGQGSNFSVSLPAELVEPPQTTETKIEIPPLKILLVEDVALNAQVAKATLEEMDHEIIVAKTGNEALDLYKPGKFDLLLLDIHLPDMTGFDVAARVKQIDLNHPPLVALTAHSVSNKDKYREIGIIDVITKPLRVDEISHVFGQLFGREKISDFVELDNTVKTEDECSNSPIPLLDEDFIEQMLSTVGAKIMMDNLALFEELVIDYLDELIQAKNQQNYKEVAAIGHKIKGSCASVGLTSMQKVAHAIQEKDKKNWLAQLDDRIAALIKARVDDVSYLKRWLETKK